MARVKQSQNIDAMIVNINSIVKNRCSLSERDSIILQDAIKQLERLKKKKGKTNKQILEEVVDVVKLLTEYFLKK